MEQGWKCPKCGNTEFFEREVSMTGGTFSRIMNFQHNHFIAITCRKCGYTEFYDKKVLKGRNTLADILDIIFGR